MAVEKRKLLQINLRLAPGELAAVDQARDGAPRNAWIRGAIYLRLGQPLPPPLAGEEFGVAPE